MPTLVNKGSDGKVAIYEKPTSGDPEAPFTDPGQHLDKVRFHTDFDMYRVAEGPTEVTVTLPAVAAASRTFSANYPLTILGQEGVADVLLLTHSLGIVPRYQIIYGANELVDGDLVQHISDGNGQRARYLSHWADTSGIYLRSSGYSSSPGSLASMSFTCEVVVFTPGAVVDDVLIDFDAATGRLQLAGGMFDSDQPLLRAQGQAGDSPWDIQVSRSIDIDNGRSRVARADGSVTTEAGYGGSFTAPPGFQGVIS